MKATLTFDLSSIEDKYEFKRCNKSLQMACVLFEIQNNIRKRIESKIEFSNEDPLPLTVLDWVFDEIYSEMDSNDINTDFLLQ